MNGALRVPGFCCRRHAMMSYLKARRALPHRRGPRPSRHHEPGPLAPRLCRGGSKSLTASAVFTEGFVMTRILERDGRAPEGQGGSKGLEGVTTEPTGDGRPVGPSKERNLHMKRIFPLLFAFSLFWPSAGVVSLLPACPSAMQAAIQTTSHEILLAAEKAPDSQVAAPQLSKGHLSGTQLRPAQAKAEEKPKTVAVPSGAVPQVQENVAALVRQGPTEKTEADEPKKVPPQDVFILRDSPLGVVKFEHRLHQERAANKCETCHHASREAKPARSAQQSCFDCHTKAPQPGMKTGRQAAFHNPTAQAGTCIDCHKMQNALGKKAPTRCMDCHKRENP